MERYVSDAAIESASGYQTDQNRDSRQVAVVGAGPAGLSCAYFLSLLGHQVTLFEAQKEPGGVMRWGIPGYRLPKSVLKKRDSKDIRFAIEMKTGIKVGKDLSFKQLNRFDAVFLSPGARTDVLLSVEGEDLKRVWKGGDFLERINSGEEGYFRKRDHRDRGRQYGHGCGPVGVAFRFQSNGCLSKDQGRNAGHP